MFNEAFSCYLFLICPHAQVYLTKDSFVPLRPLLHKASNLNFCFLNTVVDNPLQWSNRVTDT